MMDYSDFLKSISKTKCKILKNESMKKHTSFKIGGPADLFLEVYSESDLVEILKKLNIYKIQFFLLGNGSNILVSDSGIRGAVIKLAGDFKNINISNNTLCCGAGVLLSNLCLFSKKNSLKGTEFLWGIPGTVGGALYMNAGAYGGEVKDIVEECTYITKKGEKITLNKNELALDYRKSRFSETDDIITSVSFKLEDGNFEEINLKMVEFLNKRKEKQPLNYPNAGSIFKRPVGNFAGALIEYCNLKSKTIGGAMVSEKHAGFIVNKGNATCSDVVRLIQLIQDIVYEKTNIFLECEIKVIGKNSV